MQRNIRNEIYIALGALVLISFALVFAIILSNSIQDSDSTEVPDTEVASNTGTEEATEPISPSDTDTPQVVVNNTETVFIEVATTTSVTEDAETDTTSIIRLGVNTATVEASPTEIVSVDTAVPTIAASPTLTLIRLETALAPSQTVPTATSQPPTAVPSNTSPASIIPTAIKVNTGIIPTLAASPTNGAVEEQTEESSDLDMIGCTDARTYMSNLRVAQVVDEIYDIYGSAYRNDFSYYEVEIRLDRSNVYNPVSRSDKPITNGVLATINPKEYGEGIYWIRLIVANRANAIESDATCEIPVIFG